jgi:hypothetical protein
MSRAQDQGRRALLAVFAWPLLLTGLSGSGLVLALLGDGMWDAASWLLLLTPVAPVARGIVRSVPRRQ